MEDDIILNNNFKIIINKLEFYIKKHNIDLINLSSCNIKSLQNKINYITIQPPLIEHFFDNNSNIGKKNNSILVNILEKNNFAYTTWLLSTTIFTIKLVYIINIYLIFLILLLILNYKYFNNTILYIFIIIELILYHLPYFIKIE
jgi:hypothetical protein